MKLGPEEFLREELRRGCSPGNPNYVQLAKDLVHHLMPYKALKIIDYGAGVGVYANEMLQAGFIVTAQDVWAVHRSFMRNLYPGLLVVEHPVPADLMVFIEVAEHMTDAEIDKAISAITPSYILFSSTSARTEEDEEWGHVNIKEQNEWDKFWIEKNYQKIKDIGVPTLWTKMYQKI